MNQQKDDAHPLTIWDEIIPKNFNFFDDCLKKSQHNASVLLVASIGGNPPITVLNSLLSVALTIRGANVHVLICDGTLTACEQLVIHTTSDLETFSKHGVLSEVCEACYSKAKHIFENIGVHVHTYSQLISSEEIDLSKYCGTQQSINTILSYQKNGINWGEHTLAGACRFFARGDILDEPYAEGVLQQYFVSALITEIVTERLLSLHSFVSVCSHHGIYIPQGIVGEVVRKNNIRLVNWSVAYKKKCFIFSHNDTYHRTMITEPTEAWEILPWNNTMESETMNYLKSRWTHAQDWIWFHEHPNSDFNGICDAMGIDPNRPIIGLLPNVIWDAQLHYPENAFPNMLTWIFETITYFSNRPDLQLVIRVHPAEIQGTIPSRQRVVDEIKSRFGNLPNNIFVIAPDSDISTYAVMLQCNAVIIYATKTGIELTSFGIPVIVAGESWIRKKGFSWDADSPARYINILNQLPFSTRMNAEDTQKARKYAYHFFFQRMIPIECITPIAGPIPYKITLDDLDSLQKGNDRGLDTIIDGILEGNDFIYRAK